MAVPGPVDGTGPLHLSDVRAARAAMEMDTRAMLMRAAATILSEEGPGALTLRRVADAVNGSTKIIYTHFGGKDGLLDAVYRHAFAALRAAFETHAAERESSVRLAATTAAYRSFALAEPALYNVMFGDLGRAYEAPLASRREAWTSFAALREAVEKVLPLERAGESDDVTHLLWAAMHGVVSLELRKLLSPSQNGERLFCSAVEVICDARGISISKDIGGVQSP